MIGQRRGPTGPGRETVDRPGRQRRLRDDMVWTARADGVLGKGLTAMCQMRQHAAASSSYYDTCEYLDYQES